MTAQANAYVRFRRALQTGSVTLAATAAHELGRLDLRDALALTLLVGAREPRHYQRYAGRWLSRYIAEQPRMTIAEAQLLAALLAVLPERPAAAARGLEALRMERGESELADAVRRWQVETQAAR